MKEVYVIHSTNLFFCFSEKWQDVVIHTIRMTQCCISVYYFLQVLTKCSQLTFLSAVCGQIRSQKVHIVCTSLD
jgi:hypothetical protein